MSALSCEAIKEVLAEEQSRDINDVSCEEAHQYRSDKSKQLKNPNPKMVNSEFPSPRDIQAKSESVDEFLFNAKNSS